LKQPLLAAEECKPHKALDDSFMLMLMLSSALCHTDFSEVAPKGSNLASCVMHT